MFTIGFNADNYSISQCKSVETCVKLGKILMSITIKISKLKESSPFDICQKRQKVVDLHTEITCKIFFYQSIFGYHVLGPKRHNHRD